MRLSLFPRFVLVPALLMPGLPARAAGPKPTHSAAQTAAGSQSGGSQSAGPRSIGTYEDWQAATHQEGGALVCYAFTRATPPDPAPGRSEAILTVTHRPGSRNTVAVSAATAYPAGAAVQVQVDQAQLPFYTSARSAFARDGKAAVAAFGKARTAVAHPAGQRGAGQRGTGQHGAGVSDTFSLRGFNAAYAAINKACPPR